MLTPPLRLVIELGWIAFPQRNRGRVPSTKASVRFGSISLAHPDPSLFFSCSQANAITHCQVAGVGLITWPHSTLGRL